MSWQDSLVAIHTPTTGRDGKGLIGTGVQIGNDLVLTARHVVRPEKRSQKPIKLYRWYANEDERTAPELTDEALIVWESVDYDVALLRCPQLAGIPAMLLNPYAPRDLAEFVTAGFPQAGKIDDQRKPSSFFGHIITCGSSERHFEAIVDASKQPDHIEGWSGASGMPVIVNEQVVGVSLKILKGSGKGTIAASPVWHLWNDESFRGLLSVQSKALLYLDRLKEEFVDLIIMLDSKIQFNIFNKYNKNFTNYIYSKNFQTLFDEIMIFNKTNLLKLIQDIKIYIFESDDQKSKDQFYKMTNILWPILFCSEVESARQIYESQNEKKPILVDGTAGSLTMAELLAAFSTGRPTDFMPRKSNLDYPVGRNWIPVNFQVGNVENAIVTSVKVALNAMSSINPDFIREGVSPLGALQDYIGQLAQSGLDIETINVLMKQAYDRGDALPFFACVMPETPNERKFMIEEFRKLQEALPLLTVICLDKKKEAKDYEYLAGFNVILP